MHEEYEDHEVKSGYLLEVRGKGINTGRGTDKDKGEGTGKVCTDNL